MPYTFEFLDSGDVRAWSLTDEGATAERIADYAPTLYVAAGDGPEDLTAAGRRAILDEIRDALRPHPAVLETDVVERRRGFRFDAEPVLSAAVEGVDAVTEIARSAASRGVPGTVRCFDVDLSPGFRYCLDTGTDPTPDRDLRTLAVRTPATADPPLETAVVDDERIRGTPADVLAGVRDRIRRRDPDVLVVDRAETVPDLFATADAVGREAFALGRRPGYRKLAGESTYESYGRVGHSPARYAVPGRALVDRSNAFFLSETDLAGCLDLVERSRKPLQELAWASIGNVLTAIQVREARRRGVLVPWHSRRHEWFKPMRTLADADRGGLTLSPAVGVHEDVHELDFASLFPNVIVTRNVSPDTVRCDCHADREDVPEVGYSVCERRGFLPDVLEPLVAARERIKSDLAGAEDPDRQAKLAGRSSALKWILVACFGYQGFSNAKFGRIECHEAITAFAREILLEAKERLERAGWRVLHGIVDSLWVTPAGDRPGTPGHSGSEAPTPLQEVCEDISAAVGIDLEREGHFEWVAFCPRRDGAGGALTRYFGRRSVVDPPTGNEVDSSAGNEVDPSIDGDSSTDDPDAGDDFADAYKLRGIECRQRSTPPFVAATQRRLVRVFDRTRDPKAVVDELARAVARLERGEVPLAKLLTTVRAGKDPEEYAHGTRTVAAMRRAADAGREVGAGRSVSYLVVDDGARSRQRVRVESELDRVDRDRVDRSFYRDRLVRAAASVLGPLGWSERGLRAATSDLSRPDLSEF